MQEYGIFKIFSKYIFVGHATSRNEAEEIAKKFPDGKAINWTKISNRFKPGTRLKRKKPTFRSYVAVSEKEAMQWLPEKYVKEYFQEMIDKGKTESVFVYINNDEEGYFIAETKDYRKAQSYELIDKWIRER